MLITTKIGLSLIFFKKQQKSGLHYGTYNESEWGQSLHVKPQNINKMHVNMILE